MGTIIASSIIAKAQALLLDTAGVRWGSTELLGWLNDGQREIVKLKPPAGAVVESTALVPGTKQEIPAGGITFLSVVRNMGANGATPGKTVKSISSQTMDDLIPGWHSAAPSGEALFFIHDQAMPKTFWVYPPQPATPTKVEVLFVKAPSDVVGEGNPITLDDIYEIPLLNYILFRAFSKPNEAGSQARAQAFYAHFANNL